MGETNRGGFNEPVLNALRIVAGYLFLQHGIQKLFGGMGGNQVESLASLAGVAGVMEFAGGILMIVGLLTKPVAFLLSGQMAVAYFMGHAVVQGYLLAPIMNGGELAALYSFLWLFFCANGPGAFSLDALLQRRKAVPD